MTSLFFGALIVLSIPIVLAARRPCSDTIEALNFRIQHELSATARVTSLRSLQAQLATFSAPVKAVVRLEHDDKATVEMYGQPNPALEKRICGLTLPYLCQGADIGFGLRNEHQTSGVLSSFAALGFTHTVVLPLPLSRPTDQSRAVFWLGYKNGPPPHSELCRAAEFARLYSCEFFANYQIEELSRKATIAAQESERKSRFIAQLSHDLRSPLSNVRSILNLLRIESREIERHELIDIALFNCESLGQIAEDVLELSRCQAGKMICKPEIFDIIRVVSDVLQSFSISARLKGLEINLETALESCHIKADSSHIKRVLSNLISNSIKYTETGSIVAIVEKSTEFVRVRIKDSGCGMSQADLAQLFTPFSRFHGHIAEGAGLGLAVSKILVERNAGTITATSRPGEGSEFQVRLPYDPAYDSDDALYELRTAAL